ncbi:MAG TPA: hypothetical protein PKA10_19305 [Selenomonadales bacterium]|nr:hypothetical protein [Selenomonadales bacterium]
MDTIIHGIPVTADSELSREEAKKIVGDLVRDWSWEGRQLGKVEMISDGLLVHVCSYEKPFVQVVPLTKSKRSIK